MASSLTSQFLPLCKDQQWQLISLGLLLVCVLHVLILTMKKRLKLPPGPSKVPVLGNLHQLLGPLPHHTLRDMARLHGPVMLLRLGTVPVVVLSSAKAGMEMLKVHDADCSNRPMSPGPKLLSYGFKSVAFAPNGAYWRETRKILVNELLSPRRVKAAWYARQEQVEKLMNALNRNGPKPVALDEQIFSMIDRIIGTVAFGNIYGKDKFSNFDNFQHVLHEAVDALSGFSAEDFFPKPLGRIVDHLTGIISRRERIFKQLDAFFEILIEQHLDPQRAKPEDGSHDLVDFLLDVLKEKNDTLNFTKDNVKAILYEAFSAGIGTSAVTITWTMTELIRNPRVLRKVQDEIRSAVGSNERVQSNDVPKLSYLKLVVKETMRLHPPAPLLLPRETTRQVNIAGYDVPAQSRIYVNMWAIGRDPASWPDNPQEFNPERFEAVDMDIYGVQPELMPFGSGRRICPGLFMAMATMEFTLANMLHCFDWVLPEGMRAEDVSMEEKGKVVVHRKTPLMLVPTPRIPKI